FPRSCPSTDTKTPGSDLSLFSPRDIGTVLREQFRSAALRPPVHSAANSLGVHEDRVPSSEPQHRWFVDYVPQAIRARLSCSPSEVVLSYARCCGCDARVPAAEKDFRSAHEASPVSPRT